MQQREHYHSGADQTRDAGRNTGAGRPRANQNQQSPQKTGEEGTRDISDIDQQEGDMCNGELGGDMGCIDRNTRREE